MKTKFGWYFPLNDNELDYIWNKGILTTDANVLLDLYRYHESTRNSLVNSLKEFGNRLWLSNQAAEEFIKNRKKVIVSSEKTFNQATEEIEKFKTSFESSLAQLKGNRIIAADVTDGLLGDISPAIEIALENISKSKSSYPKFLEEDPILDELSQMFEGAVGDSFSAEEYSEIKLEAENRRQKKIPPGYRDGDKEGDQPYGDFLIWRQLLIHSRNTETPIIFVTSERKDDWWEIISGKTLGPRPELLREAYELSGQNILIYQTDRFLEYSSIRAGQEIDTSVVDEIRAVDLMRSDIEHAVEVVEQNTTSISENIQRGDLVLNLHRPVKNFTGRGILDPSMPDTPTITVSLKSAPDNLGKIKLRGGSGSDFDFNLHVISAEFGEMLPVGQYILQYTASCESSKSSNVTVRQLSEVIGVSTDKLIEQLSAAGIEVADDTTSLSDEDKLRLLESLRTRNRK